MVLATGGGAYMDDTTRATMKSAAFYHLAAGRRSKFCWAGCKKRQEHEQARPLLEQWRYARHAWKNCCWCASRSMPWPIWCWNPATSRMPCWWTRLLRAGVAWQAMRSAMSDETITVGLGERAYDIHVGGGLLSALARC